MSLIHFIWVLFKVIKHRSNFISLHGEIQIFQALFLDMLFFHLMYNILAFLLFNLCVFHIMPPDLTHLPPPKKNIEIKVGGKEEGENLIKEVSV